MPFSVKKALVFPIYETLFPQILIYMENDNVSHGKLQSLDPQKLCLPRYEKAEILRGKIILGAQSESGVHFYRIDS